MPEKAPGWTEGVDQGDEEARRGGGRRGPRASRLALHTTTIALDSSILDLHLSLLSLSAIYRPDLLSFVHHRPKGHYIHFGLRSSNPLSPNRHF
jgi:hypothetical protein